jgi:tetratricopeptide (TPR) repeat protein
MPERTVFVSYSHKDKDLLGPLVAQLKALEQAGLLDVWVDTRIDAGDKWYVDIEEAMERAVVAVCLVSEHFLASDFCTKEEIPFLLKRTEQDGLLIIPVLLSDCPWYAHRWVEERQLVPGEGQSVRTNYPTNPAAVFSKVARRIHDKFSDPNYRPPKPRLKWSPLAPERINRTRLPETGAALFGRDEELKLLDAVWSDDSSSRTRVLAFTAHGGVGKSTLINHWLDEMARDHFRGASCVFGWSFHSQGVREQGQASADTFVAEALRFFGDEAMAASPASAWDKGARLARLVGADRALLVLDGMEPLQSAQTYERGKLRDPALESLLRGLTKQSAGLCVITTRESIPDLATRPGFAERDLEQISPEAGRALLRTLRVVGTDAELEALAGRFGPHALAVSLLGVYLREHPGHGIGPAQALDRLRGTRPIDRVLTGFEQWLGESAAREALRLLGFFDRPADPGCLRALRAAPAIPGLTDLLAVLGEPEWNRALDRLEKLRLIHLQENESGDRWVDTHPVIREHFAEQLKGTDVWREGHRRIYEHLCASTPDRPQPTLEDLQPLYQAVAHGCQAGLQQEACEKVYFARIARGNEAYTVKKLGVFGSELGAVACFFDQPWKRVSPTLTEAVQAWLLNAAAYRLRALGRLNEALEPMRAGLKNYLKQEHWGFSARLASNLSELELTLGAVAGAVGDAEQSVTYADRSDDADWQWISRTTHADALHQAGRRAAAETRFREAEQMEAQRHPEYPLLYSLWGFRYCDLLLAASECAAWQRVLAPSDQTSTSQRLAECKSVEQRTVTTRGWEGLLFEDGLLEVALDHLTLGRAALYAAILERSAAFTPLQRPNESAAPSGDERRSGLKVALQTSSRELDAAVDGLRRSGYMDDLPRGLLTRAWQRFLDGKCAGPQSAQEDLDEAWEIAERGPMRLFLADIHLHRARLFFREATYPWESPTVDLAAARRLIEQCGYGRRKEELEDAKAGLRQQHS